MPLHWLDYFIIIIIITIDALFIIYQQQNGNDDVCLKFIFCKILIKLTMIQRRIDFSFSKKKFCWISHNAWLIY